MINDECLMKKLLLILFFGVIASRSFAITDSIEGKWRGTIIGHVDDRDYFLNATIKHDKDLNYTIELKIFSKDYTGNYLLKTTLNKNKLYINSFEKLNEFPTEVLHFEDCFTGYFQLKKNEKKMPELDLYRNPVYRYTYTFRTKDSAGNLIPDFECFTSILLHPAMLDSNYQSLERAIDSIISKKKNNYKDMSKRKIVSGKEWSVKNEKITLQVWDNNKEDSDVVSLKFNDTWILTNFLLKKEKYTIHLDLKNKNNQLLLFAENLGSIPPNTAAISIDDNILVRTFILNSDLNKSETIKITLDKPTK